MEVFGNLGSVALFGNMGAVEKIEAFISSAPNYFAKVVRSGETIMDMVNPEFNLGVQEIIEAAIRSSKSGQAVNLPLK